MEKTRKRVYSYFCMLIKFLWRGALLTCALVQLSVENPVRSAAIFFAGFASIANVVAKNEKRQIRVIRVHVSVASSLLSPRHARQQQHPKRNPVLPQNQNCLNIFSSDSIVGNNNILSNSFFPKKSTQSKASLWIWKGAEEVIQ